MRAFAAFALAATLAAPAVAADLGGRVAVAVEPAAEYPGLPACDDPGVLGKLVSRQHAAERDTFQDGVVIAAIDDIRQRYGRVKFVSAIAHRHCVARALLAAPYRSDRLYYVISERQGFASMGWGLDFCMPRHDPYRVYDADCRVLK